MAAQMNRPCVARRSLTAAGILAALLIGPGARAKPAPPQLTVSIERVDRAESVHLAKALRAAISKEAGGGPAVLMLHSRPIGLEPAVAPEADDKSGRGRSDRRREVSPPGEHATGSTAPRAPAPRARARKKHGKAPPPPLAPGRQVPRTPIPTRDTDPADISGGLLKEAESLAVPAAGRGEGSVRNLDKPAAEKAAGRTRLHEDPETGQPQGSGTTRSSGPARRIAPHGPPGTGGAGMGSTGPKGTDPGQGGKRR